MGSSETTARRQETATQETTARRQETTGDDTRRQRHRRQRHRRRQETTGDDRRRQETTGDDTRRQRDNRTRPRSRCSVRVGCGEPHVTAEGGSLCVDRRFSARSCYKPLSSLSLSASYTPHTFIPPVHHVHSHADSHAGRSSRAPKRTSFVAGSQKGDGVISPCMPMCSYEARA